MYFKPQNLISTGEVSRLFNVKNNVTKLYKDAIYWPDNGYSCYDEYMFNVQEVLNIHKDKLSNRLFRTNKNILTTEMVISFQNKWFDVLNQLLGNGTFTIYYNFLIQDDEFYFYDNKETNENAQLLLSKYREIKETTIIEKLAKGLEARFKHEISYRRYQLSTKKYLNELSSEFDISDLNVSIDHIKDLALEKFNENIDIKQYIRDIRQEHKDFDKFSKSLDIKAKKDRKIKEKLNASEFKKSLFLDTETTGLGDDDEIVQIGIIDHNGKVLLNELIKPLKPIYQSASEIHGITNETVKNAHSYTEIHDKIVEIVKDKNLLIYNKSFDLDMLQQTAFKHGWSGYEFEYKKAFCVMNWYAKIYGEYNDYFGSYTWQKLNNAAYQQDIDISDLTEHEAVSDCEITRRLVTKLISDNPIF